MEPHNKSEAFGKHAHMCRRNKKSFVERVTLLADSHGIRRATLRVEALISQSSSKLVLTLHELRFPIRHEPNSGRKVRGSSSGRMALHTASLQVKVACSCKGPHISSPRNVIMSRFSISVIQVSQFLDEEMLSPVLHGKTYIPKTSTSRGINNSIQLRNVIV